MAYLVTGGAGFIGSHLCERLVKEGSEIICVDNFNDFYDPLIKRRNIEGLQKKANFKLYELDILDFPKLQAVFEQNDIDVIIHLAARAGVRPSIKEPLLYQEVNVRGTLNLLELARRFNVPKFVFASSSSVYGNNKKVPFSEQDNVDNPVSPYAATKKAGELLAYTYHHLYDISISCIRFFTVYGPRQRPDMAIHK
ncbi:epimerase, partial [candidate division KSB1 bacterium]